MHHGARPCASAGLSARSLPEPWHHSQPGQPGHARRVPVVGRSLSLCEPGFLSCCRLGSKAAALTSIRAALRGASQQTPALPSPSRNAQRWNRAADTFTLPLSCKFCCQPVSLTLGELGHQARLCVDQHLVLGKVEGQQSPVLRDSWGPVCKGHSVTLSATIWCSESWGGGL